MHRLPSLGLAVILLAAGCTTPTALTTPESAAESESAAGSPTAAPTPTAIPTLPFTTAEADEAPPGAISVEMLGWSYAPDQLSAPAGTVVIFVANTTGFQKHNMNVGRAIGEPLAETPLIWPGKGLLFSIEGLTPGSYTFWDSVYRPEEHAYFYQLGMVGTLTITP